MKEFIQHITSQLNDLYPADEAEALAWWIAEELTGQSRTQLQFGYKGTINFPNLQTIIERLRDFEPIQYIFGHTLWCGLDIKVTPATLIPRPETAELVNKVERVKMEGDRLKVLDIGTGSGCIAIALKKAHPEWNVMGIDISAEAIEVAKENAVRNGADVSFLQKDIFPDEIECFGTYDIVVSNPPYICEKEKKDMRPNVLNYEPASAIFVPDNDPLLFYRRIAELRLGTYLFFEINETYAVEMENLLRNTHYIDIQTHNDIYGKPRVIQGRMAE